MNQDIYQAEQKYPLISFSLLFSFLLKQVKSPARKSTELPELLMTPEAALPQKEIAITENPDSGTDQTAQITVTTNQKIVFLILGIITLSGFVLNWLVAFQLIITILTVHYFFDLIFNLFLIIRSFSKDREIKIDQTQFQNISEDELPAYTIFCPLYKEGNILPQFVQAISALDYPKAKLQVLLLLEEDDLQTILLAHKLKLPSYFEIIVVPASLPKTKPKACNYGLSLARGEFCVIFDAEDIPDPLQLKKAYLVFKNSPADIGCIQAKLNFYNSRQNFLTRLFTADYSLWFNLVLTGLQSINAPIPLGGTSNHFRTAVLREMNGWDAFNVTEDADLGIRLNKKGYKTVMIDSFTREEAASSLPNWFRQRTRWIKGYMQTYLVHTRQLTHFKGFAGFKRLICFQAIVGGKVLSLFINPLMWTMTIVYFVFRPFAGGFIESLYLTPVFYLGVFTLIIGNFLYFYNFMMGLAKAEEWDLVIYTVLVPFYWILISAAAINAAVELIRRPFHWNKTLHGEHLEQSLLVQNAEVIGLQPAGAV